MSHAPWLHILFDPDKLVQAAEILSEEIKKDIIPLNIDSIAVTGVSGVAIGGLLSYLTGLPLIIVRKEEGSHSGLTVECSSEIENFNYIFVDDLIDTGKTLKRVEDALDSMNNGVSNLKKVYMYNATSFDTEYRLHRNHSLRIPSFSFRMDE